MFDRLRYEVSRGCSCPKCLTFFEDYDRQARRPPFASRRNVWRACKSAIRLQLKHYNQVRLREELEDWSFLHSHLLSWLNRQPAWALLVMEDPSLLEPLLPANPDTTVAAKEEGENV